MEIKGIPSHIKANRRSYGHHMSVMGISGRSAFYPTACKEEAFHAVGKYVAFDNDADDIMGPECDEDIDMDNPTIFYWVRPTLSKANKMIRARRVGRILTMLAESQGCKAPIIMADFGVGDGAGTNNLMAVEVDQFYLGSPLALSGLLTLLRGAVKSTFVFNSLNNFISILTSEKNTIAASDKLHLSKARANKILDRFLKKDLDVFKLKPHEAFSRGKNASLCYYGIASHPGLAHMVEIDVDNIYDDGNW